MDSTGGAIVADGLARTVELVGGSRTVYNQSPGLPFISGSGSTTTDSGLGFLVQTTSSSVTLQYETNWAGNLVIASSNGLGGTFNIKRSGGTVTVAPNSSMTVQSGSTVNISNDNSSTLVASTVPDATYGFLTAGTAGTLPVLNNVLYDGTHAVAVANSGTFNVNAGTQTVGAITGNGTFNVTSTATVFAPSISQSAAFVFPAATLNLTGPGAVANSLILANSGNLNVTGGTHTVGTLGNSPTAGTTSVSNGGTLIATAGLYQGTLNLNPAGRLNLTNTNVLTNGVNNLNINGGLLDLQGTGQGTGLYVQSTGSGAIFSAVQQGSGQAILPNGNGYGNVSWAGTSGITSSVLAANSGSALAASSSNYGVGYYNQYGQTGSGLNATLVQTALLGDTNLKGNVQQSDVTLVRSNIGKSGLGWAGGDFYDQGVVGLDDLNAAIRNFKAGTTYTAGPITPGVTLGGGSAVVNYNYQSGYLSLVVTGAPDIDNFSVYCDQAPSRTSAQLSTTQSFGLILGGGWQASDNTGLYQYDWMQSQTDMQEANLPAGTYNLAYLPGLNGSDFQFESLPGVTFYNSVGVPTADNVAVVPEPGTLALLAAGVLAAGASWLRRRSASAACRNDADGRFVSRLGGAVQAPPSQFISRVFVCDRLKCKRRHC